MSKYSVVMIRHGESEWNQKNLFCGWFDSDLSDAGRAEAEAAGKALKGLFHSTYHTGIHRVHYIRYYTKNFGPKWLVIYLFRCWKKVRYCSFFTFTKSK